MTTATSATISVAALLIVVVAGPLALVALLAAHDVGAAGSRPTTTSMSAPRATSASATAHGRDSALPTTSERRPTLCRYTADGKTRVFQLTTLPTK